MNARGTVAAAFSLRGLYFVTAGMLALTGFGQMPIFKRYYIADIPGLGWLAQFYTTHFLHYFGAAVLLGLIAYFVADFFVDRRSTRRVTASGRTQVVFLAGLVATGIPRVIKNYEGYFMSEGWIVFLDIFHLTLAMGFILCGLFRMLTGKRWTT